MKGLSVLSLILPAFLTPAQVWSDPDTGKAGQIVDELMVDCRAFINFSSCATHPNTAGRTLLIAGPYTTNGLTINGRGLSFLDNGKLMIVSGTVIHNGPFSAPLSQVIDGPGSFMFAPNGGVRDIFPQWFGLSTASTDNGKSLQKAVNSLPGGGTVKLTGAGTYLTSRIVPKSGVNLIGDTWHFVLKLKNGQNTDMIRAEPTTTINNIRISGFSIDGNKANNPSTSAGTAIHFGGTNIEVDNMYIHDTAGAGIILGVPARGGNYRISNNYVLNPSVPNIGWGSIAVTGGENVVISDNFAVSTDGNQGYGIDLEPNPGWVVKRARIIGNTVLKGRISVGVSDPTATTESVAVESNYVDGQGAFGAEYDSGSAMYAKNVTGNLTIQDNVFIAPNQSSGGIRLENTDNFTLQNNTVYVRNHAFKGSEFGLWVINSHYGLVTANSFLALRGHTPRFGIYEQGSSDYNAYRSNKFSGFAVEYVLKGTHSKVDTPSDAGR